MVGTAGTASRVVERRRARMGLLLRRKAALLGRAGVAAVETEAGAGARAAERIVRNRDVAEWRHGGRIDAWKHSLPC